MLIPAEKDGQEQLPAVQPVKLIFLVVLWLRSAETLHAITGKRVQPVLRIAEHAQLAVAEEAVAEEARQVHPNLHQEVHHQVQAVQL